MAGLQKLKGCVSRLVAAVGTLDALGPRVSSGGGPCARSTEAAMELLRHFTSALSPRDCPFVLIECVRGRVQGPSAELPSPSPDAARGFLYKVLNLKVLGLPG